MLKKFKLRADKARSWMFRGGEPPPEKRKKITMCRHCHTFYYKNLWHFDKPLYLKVDIDEEVPVKFTECLACLEQENSFYEMESKNTSFA